MNNNTKETALANNHSNANRSHNHSSSSNESKAADESDKTKKDTSPRPSSSKKVSFEGILKHNPVNVDTGGLRRFLRIAAKQKKQLDLSLNHAAVIDANGVSEEDMDPKENNLANNDNK